MDFKKSSIYLPVVLVIIIVLFMYYKNDNNHFLNNILHSHKHKTTENFSTKQNLNIIKNIPKYIESESESQNYVESEHNLGECIKKIRENKAENYNRMVNTNQIMFDINEIKEAKNNKNPNRSQKIAALNCSYFDLDNDVLNKSILPQENELFIT